MPQWLQGLGLESNDPSTVLLRLLLAAVAGWLVAFVHRRTSGDPVPQSFRATLVLLTILIAGVTQIIGDSVARAFALVGALSIVRFRTVVRDTRDTVFVIFAVTVGMAMGTGHFMTGAMALVVVGAMAFALTPRGEREAGPYLLEVQVALGTSSDELLHAVFKRSVARSAVVQAGTARRGAALATAYEVWLRPRVNVVTLIAEINQLEGIQSAELVLRRDEP